MTVNCRSLRSQQQENELTTLIDTYEPHIIHARETHLDKTISIAEIIDTNIYEKSPESIMFGRLFECVSLVSDVFKLSTASILLSGCL
jgi:hypothetical protein